MQIVAHAAVEDGKCALTGLRTADVALPDTRANDAGHRIDDVAPVRFGDRDALEQFRSPAARSVFLDIAAVEVTRISSVFLWVVIVAA